jgi:hypothetical protein
MVEKWKGGGERPVRTIRCSTEYKTNGLARVGKKRWVPWCDGSRCWLCSGVGESVKEIVSEASENVCKVELDLEYRREIRNLLEGGDDVA